VFPQHTKCIQCKKTYSLPFQMLEVEVSERKAFHLKTNFYQFGI
jgi:hypothetical protein